MPLRNGLKPAPKLQRSRMRMATDRLVITDLHASFSAHGLARNPDDARGAGFVFPVLLTRKQERNKADWNERQRPHAPIYGSGLDQIVCVIVSCSTIQSAVEKRV